MTYIEKQEFDRVISIIEGFVRDTENPICDVQNYAKTFIEKRVGIILFEDRQRWIGILEDIKSLSTYPEKFLLLTSHIKAYKKRTAYSVDINHGQLDDQAVAALNAFAEGVTEVYGSISYHCVPIELLETTGYKKEDYFWV